MAIPWPILPVARGSGGSGLGVSWWSPRSSPRRVLGPEHGAGACVVSGGVVLGWVCPSIPYGSRLVAYCDVYVSAGLRCCGRYIIGVSVGVGVVGPVGGCRESGYDGLCHCLIEAWCPAGQFPAAGGGVVGVWVRFEAFQFAYFWHVDVHGRRPFGPFESAECALRERRG